MLEPVPGREMAWDISVGARTAAVEEPLSVQIAKGTVLYKTRLKNHIQLLEL